MTLTRVLFEGVTEVHLAHDDCLKLNRSFTSSTGARDRSRGKIRPSCSYESTTPGSATCDENGNCIEDNEFERVCTYMKLIVPALGEHDQFVDPAKELACVGDDLNGPGLAAECMRGA